MTNASYCKPAFAWKYLAYLHLLYRTNRPTLSISARTLSVKSLRLQLFQSRRYIETSEDKYLIHFKPLTSCTKIKKDGVEQVEIDADDDFRAAYEAIANHSFFHILKSIDAFMQSPQLSFTSSATDIPSEAWAAIGFYVGKLYTSLKVAHVMNTCILLKK